MKNILVSLLLVVSLAFSADNTGRPLYDTDRNPVGLGVNLSDSLPQVRWIQVDSTGAMITSFAGTMITQEERLYPYFTSGLMDSTDIDTLYMFPLPVVSFWLQNSSSTDTLEISWRGTAFPASYISINPLASFGLENIWRPDSLNGLYMAGSADSIPWQLVVLSDSLYLP
jgi:hypothetical protein